MKENLKGGDCVGQNLQDLEGLLSRSARPEDLNPLYYVINLMQYKADVHEYDYRSKLILEKELEEHKEKLTEEEFIEAEKLLKKYETMWGDKLYSPYNIEKCREYEIEYRNLIVYHFLNIIENLINSLYYFFSKILKNQGIQEYTAYNKHYF